MSEIQIIRYILIFLGSIVVGFYVGMIYAYYKAKKGKLP